MLNTLVESNRRHTWYAREGVLSLVVHAVLIALVVIVGAPLAESADLKREPERLVFAAPVEERPAAEPEPEEPPPPKKEPPRKVKPPRRERPRPETATPPELPKGFQTLVAPVTIPDKIPEIDLSKAITNEADFSGRGVQGGVASGTGGVGRAGESAERGRVYLDFQVERSVRVRSGNPRPRYPPSLERLGVEGIVLLQFVVDASGRAVKGSAKVLKSTNELFTRAVLDVLPKLHFEPATVGGSPVRQLVQMPFRFRQQ